MHVSHKSPSQKSSMVHTLTTPCEGKLCTGKGGKDEGTDIPCSWCQRYVAKFTEYDVTKQNMNPSPQTMWELICLGQGGPRPADLEGEIITPEVETPSGLLQERRQQRWEVDQKALLARHLEVRSTRPHSRHSTLWQQHPGQFTKDWCPPHNLCGRMRGSLKPLFFLRLQTHCGLILKWITMSYCDAHPSLGHQKFISSLIFEARSPTGTAAWSLKARSLMGGKPWLSVNVALTLGN